MYIERVPNRNSPPAVLLRESYREHGRVCKRTLANLSKWPDHLVEGLRTLLKGGVALPSLDSAFEILRSRPHGHVAATLGVARRRGLETLLDRRPSHERALALAMIIARIVEPRSKLATARGLSSETTTHTLGEELGVEEAGADELYSAMDWLLKRQQRIERRLAEQHLEDGSLVLCDVTSVYFEGAKCALARRGYSKDGKPGKPQIVFALLCDRDGCPVAVEVFEGNTADPGTLSAQVQKLKERFSLDRMIMVGDRGLLTSARIREDLEPGGLSWITALRAPAIRTLVQQGHLQLSIFDQQDLAEVSAPELYPAERLIVCRNPLLAARRRRKREELLDATERKLEAVAEATKRSQRSLRGKDKIAARADRALRAHKVGKHFDTEIEEDGFRYSRKLAQIAEEAALDGFYVIRTNVAEADLPAPEAVRAYKSLSRVERAFRSYKSVDLKVRPVHHRPSRQSASPRLSVHARLLRRVAHATPSRSLALRRRRPKGRTLLARPAGSPVPRSPRQGERQAHTGRTTRPQLPDPARRPRHPDPKSRPECRARRTPPRMSWPDRHPSRPRRSASSTSDLDQPYPVANTPKSQVCPVIAGNFTHRTAELRPRPRTGASSRRPRSLS